jgi:hypothetical protein
MRSGLAFCVAIGIAIAIAPAAAHGAPPSSSTPPPSKSACIDAYKSSQELSRAGSLTQARSAALVCAREPCPAVLRKDCGEWVADVEQRLPTLLVVVRDENGRDVAAARVLVDGVEVAKTLDGRPIEVDPGERKLEVIVAGKPPFKQSIVAREREKGREVAFAFPPAKTAPPPVTQPPVGPPRPETPAERPLPWSFWAAAGASGVGLAGFGILGVSGLVLRGDLDECKPSCSQERIDHGKTSFLVADVFLGVAVIGAGIATYIYLTRP